MKRPLFLTFSLLFVAGAVAFAQNSGQARSVSVTGTVETKTAPDRIVWRINLTDTDQDMRTAVARNDEKIKSVTALQKKLGVEEGDFEAGQIYIRREYERDQYGRPGSFKHFVVTRTAIIRQRDLKRFDEFLESLISSADMEVSFNFESSRIYVLRADTRLKALQAAKDKAGAMAQAVGARLGRVLTIDEYPPGERRQSSIVSNTAYMESAPSADIASDRFVPGAIDVRVTVYVTFELE